DVGGGVYSQDAILTLSNCDVRYSRASSGGGVYAETSFGSALLDHCTLDSNHADAGSAVTFHGFSSSSAKVVDDIENTTVSNSDGGGVFAQNGGLLMLRNSIISGNAGDGLTIQGGYDEFNNQIINSSISNNQGTGIALNYFTNTLTVQNSSICSNAR